MAQNKGLSAEEFTEHLRSTFCLLSPCLVQVTEHILGFWVLAPHHYRSQSIYEATSVCWIYANKVHRAFMEHLLYAGSTLSILH